MFNFIKKRKLPKRLLLLSALPLDMASFKEAYHSGHSDFIASLKVLYNTSDIDYMWDQYKICANQMHKTFALIRKYGGTVITNFSIDDLQVISNYDIVIILAHHSNVSDAIEIDNKMCRSRDFVYCIPANCRIILDITSCYSAYLLPWIKARIPDSKIVGINHTTSLMTRLKVITYAVLMMAEKEIDEYLSVFRTAWNRSGIFVSDISEKDVKLGSKLLSSIYAPAEVLKGEDFVLSIFLHKFEDADEIEIRSRGIDPDASKRNQLLLKMKLRKGDFVEFQILYNESLYSGLEVDEFTKGIYWDNTIESVEFIFSVPKGFDKSSFVGKVKLAVNKDPIGDMVFKIKVVDAVAPKEANVCSPISFEPFDKIKDMKENGQQLIHILQNRIKELQHNLQINDSSEIDMCKKCIYLIQSKPIERRHSPLRVFISSTSDMHLFRQIMMKQIETCEMYADMYERWGQGNDYPRDMCCTHVLQSDIFVCILGAKYGFIEPIWNKSMTEIEYRVASNAGIPMLIYILKDYKQKMQQLNGDEFLASKRQEAFIEELKNKRLVCLFSNELNLQLQANTELITLKSRLLWIN